MTPLAPNRSIVHAPVAEPAASATWLDEVLRELGSGPAHLVGASYGGWIALNQALRAPGRVATITLLEPAGLQKIDARFWWWLYINGLATLAPQLPAQAPGRLARSPLLADSP